ncbi:cation:proton antiporter subunit C [Nannocystis pusilla]|uniref:Cation:proton antiporter subunit C n=1 Tax=Nannocystis pusilla TaxID=889268 RepID=A0ABS7U549_9BACT|nr:cation:proton antiporter subunit C [Nannocystis pusilla]
MSLSTLYAMTGVALFSLGFHALLVQRHLLRKVLALNVLGSATFLLLVGMARRGGDTPDPVPHAMVLTGIVVAVSATALALSLARRLKAAQGLVRLPEDMPE